MDEASITQYILDTFDGVHAFAAPSDDIFFFYNPDRSHPDTFYFATINNRDNPYDNVSHLDRPSVFRLNIGVRKPTYRALFDQPTSQSATDDAPATDYDLTALDRVMPHPLYQQMNWVCILNPSATTLQTILQPLLAEAYEWAVRKHTKRFAIK